MQDLCIIGSTNIDLVFRAPKFPHSGETLKGHSFATHFGGKGGNQAVHAAKTGVSVTLISKVGEDSFGEDCLKNYRRRGVNTDHVFRTSTSTGVASIVVNEQGENNIIVVAGGNGELTSKDVLLAQEAIKGAKVIVGQLEVPLSATQAAFVIAKKSDAVTVFNPAPAEQLSSDFLSLIDVLVLNETEVEALSGIKINDMTACEKAAKALQSLGPAAVVITLGAQGAYGRVGVETWLIEPISVKVVDTTGAGDCFVGTLAAHLSQGKSLYAAVQLANQAAAAKVTRMGAQG